MTVIVTAGHVDHGKSSLVRAITGTDPDRLAEEKRRGMTIELGFAHAVHNDEILSFVDAPGHADLVRTMIAGASAVDTALLVVDAREGWMPQTHEHLAILELLGISRGVVAVTKCDMVEAERIQKVHADTERIVGDSPVDWQATISVSVIDHTGIDDLVAALRSAVQTPPSRDRRSLPVRLFVDRVFTISGAGTVVTGTLEHGTIDTGDILEIAGTARSVRVRSVHTHGSHVARGVAGTRCAINLADVSTDDVRRGDALVAQGQWHVTKVFDARLTLARDNDTWPSPGGGFIAHFGTDRQECTVRPLSEPGLWRIRTHAAWPLAPGDRFVLRRSGDSSTIGGGTVLDVAPTRRLSRSRPDGSVESQLIDHGWIDVDEARQLTGVALEPTAGRWCAAPSVVADTSEKLRATLANGELRLERLAPWEKDLVTTFDDVVVSGGVARRSGTSDIDNHPVAHEIRSWGLTGPSTSGLDRDIMRRLVASGVVFEHDSVAFHRDTLGEVRPRVAALLENHQSGVTVSMLRDTFGITRKHAVPLAECLDRVGFTVRRGDVRHAGPRLHDDLK